MFNVAVACAVHAGFELHQAGHEGMQLALGALHLCLHLTQLLAKPGALAHTGGSQLIQLQQGKAIQQRRQQQRTATAVQCSAEISKGSISTQVQLAGQ